MTLRNDYGPEFESLWRVYPNHSAKLTAFKSWTKHVAPGDRQALVDHVVERARFDEAWVKGYVPHLATFINGARWEDEYRRVRKERHHASFDPVDRQEPMTQEEYQRATAARDLALQQLRVRH